MSASNAMKIKVATDVAAQGNKISLHSGPPGINGANEISASGTVDTTWGAPAIGSGADADKAVMTGSACLFNVAAGTTITHFGVKSAAGVFLWGDAVTPTISVAGGAGQVNITPIFKYQQP